MYWNYKATAFEIGKEVCFYACLIKTYIYCGECSMFNVQLMLSCLLFYEWPMTMYYYIPFHRTPSTEHQSLVSTFILVQIIIIVVGETLSWKFLFMSFGKSSRSLFSNSANSQVSSFNVLCILNSLWLSKPFLENRTIPESQTNCSLLYVYNTECQKFFHFG